jgi:hypothetical protein
MSYQVMDENETENFKTKYLSDFIGGAVYLYKMALNICFEFGRSSEVHQGSEKCLTRSI